MEAKVIKVINDGWILVINKGSKDGVKEGMKFRVIERTEEKLYDPDTNEFLGILEIPKGVGEVIFVQEKYSLLESRNYEYEEVDKETTALHPLISILFPNPQTQKQLEILKKIFTPPEEPKKVITKKIPFKNPKIGDIAIPI